ncbi:MAG: MYXO-CTERM sorting domain-containing protein [Sandaracinaceae bacterium]|nr:MYXO-CTERM sorting domain-containing protein [Sandaracinaceae bacterium]
MGDAATDAGDDAATDGGQDAANGDAAVGDAGTNPDMGGGLTGGGGCGCTVTDGETSEPLAWLGSVLVVGLVIRRRRARHPR